MPITPPDDDQPSSTSSDGYAGRFPIDAPGLEVTFEIRGSTGEIQLGGTAPLGLAPAAVAAIEHVRLLHPDIAFHLAADHPVQALDPWPEAVADAAGLPHRRDLLQLRRPLPVEADHPARLAAPAIEVRPFEVEDDDEAWVRVNNRAFAQHPDQGAETVDTLHARFDAEWDDPSGFLVADDADRPGELSGFCWTKVHPATDDDPELGEIYVIGVDPSHRGERLGPSFTLAGLDHLAALGIATANLYVDADNEPARRLYDRLGFATHQRRRVYTP